MTYRIEDQPNDHIDTTAFEVMEKAFGIDPRYQIFITHDVQIDYLPLQEKIRRSEVEELKNPTPLLGHRPIPFRDVPEDDKPSYEENGLSDREKSTSLVWYPQMSPRRKRYLVARFRIAAIRRVENAFGIGLKEFKDIDKHPTVTLYDVSRAIDEFRLGQLKKSD